MGKGLLERLGLRRKPLLPLQAFRERVAEEVRSRRPDAEPARDGETELTLPEGGSIDVQRAYSYYRENPGQLRRLVKRLVDLLLHDPPKATPDDLIVLVRPASFEAGGGGGIVRRLPQGLIGIVAVDALEHHAFASAAELRADLGMEDSQMWGGAGGNLRRRLDMTPPTYKPGRVMGITTDVGLASSLILEDQFWNHPQLARLGDLVVAPLERDELIVAPLGEPDLVRALRGLVASRANSDFLCDKLLLRRDGRWEAFD